MASDLRLNSLLKWSIQNSNTDGQSTANTTTPTDQTQHLAPSTATTYNGTQGSTAETASRGLTPEMLSSLFGGPSEADLMKAAMEVLVADDDSGDVSLDDKLVAFDNFEQLIESMDNANNMEPLGLWSPLVGLLAHREPDMRRMAAWCVGTAVQNNEKSQDKVCPVLFFKKKKIRFLFMLNGLLLTNRSDHRAKRPPNPRPNGHLRPRPRRAQKSRLRHLLRRPKLPARHG